jgi:PAS domain S-box-containing protein
MEQSLVLRRYPYFIAGVLVFLGLYLASLYNYLLFHSLAEIFSIIVACGIFMVTWNSRRFLDNNYLLFIGIAYLFVGGLDLIHTLSYKGMGIFQGYEPNLATQFWVAARYTESVSLLIAPLFLRRKLKVNILFSSYTFALLLFLISIFYWKIFPLCFVEGVGLTPFKKISEYIISLILLASIVLLLKNRGKFDRDVLKWLVWSILLTIASELAFTFYIDTYGFANLLGHFFKIVSFYLIYKALIQMGLSRPYDLLFRNLKQSEVLLREEKNKIQNYLDIAGVILLVIDANQKVSLINRKGGKILGYNENEMIGKNWFDTFVPEKNRDEAKAEFRKLADGEIDAIEYFENPILTRSGKERIIGWHYVVLKDEKGNVTFTLSSGEDITERKRADEALRQSEKKFRELFDEAPVGYFEYDGQGRITNVNRTELKMLGYALEEMIGQPPWKFIVEEEIARQQILDMLAGTMPPVQGLGRTYRRKDGTTFPALVQDRLLQDAERKILGIRATIQDITERKRAEETLRESELKYRIVADNTYDWEHWGDPAGKYLYVSPSCKRITGYGPEEFMAKSNLMESLIVPEDRYLFEAHTRNEVKKRLVDEVEFRIKRSDGELRWIHHICQPVFDHKGNYLGFRGSNRDITERKRMEEELRKSRDELELRIQERTTELLKAYKKLEEQSRILEGFFTSTITPLVFLDRNFDFVRVNKAYAKACQRDISEFPGHNHFEFYPHEENEAIFKQVVETKAPYQAFAKPFSFPDHPEWGLTYWDWTLTPILNDGGETEFLVFSLEDVTDRKRAEEAAQAQHALREAIENSLVTGIMVVEKDGRIAHVNPALCRMTGWTEEELIGSMPPFAFWPIEPLEIRARSFLALLRGKIPLETFEVRLRRKNGESFDALVLVSSLKNAQGKALGWVASIGDITQRKETERYINATNALLSLFSKKSLRKEYLDSVVDLIQSWSGCRCVGIRVSNRHGLIPYESYVGFSQEFWESENWLSTQRDQCVCVRIVTGNSAPQDASVITAGGSFHCGNVLTFMNHLSKEEKSRYRGVCVRHGFLSVTIIPIRYLDRVVGAIHLADEREACVPLSVVEFLESTAPLIGEAVNRLNLEEELRESENRLRALSSQLLTVQEMERKRIAMELHDGIGQMLTAIKFKVENLLQEKGKGKAKAKEKSLEAIVPMVRESVEEVRRIQMDLRPSTLDDLGILATLGWFCREYQKIYSHIRIEKEIGLQESEVSLPLKTVVYRLTQEALNNIAKHSKADFVHLCLRKKGDAIEWVVKDNGMGFDLEETLSSERSERGLGLNSMRERTELSGGTFEIETTPGIGTVIRASWPTAVE